MPETRATSIIEDINSAPVAFGVCLFLYSGFSEIEPTQWTTSILPTLSHPAHGESPTGGISNLRLHLPRYWADKLPLAPGAAILSSNVHVTLRRNDRAQSSLLALNPRPGDS